MFRRDELTKDHGRFAPRCVSLRSWAWMNENEYGYPGRDETVLRMAGLIKQTSTQNWYMEIIPATRVSRRGTIYHSVAACVSAAPKWAIKMARQLVEDQSMIQRLKIGRKQKRVGTRGSRIRQHEGLAPGYILMIPIEVRAQILQAAASNPLVHAMVTDEQGGLETAIIVARDMKKQVGS